MVIWWWSGKGNENEADPDNDDEYEDPDSHLMGDDGEEPVDEPDARDGCQKYKPEVQKYVDLQREKYK